MMDSEKVKELALQAINDEGGFLVEFSVGSDNKISISADHPEGITLEKLGRISRGIEAHFDRDKEDFGIEVSSPGVGKPFLVEEQYKANIGRPVKVVMADGDIFKGDMTAFEDQHVTLKWKERVPKEKGKGKMVVTREEKISLEGIKETRLEIRF